MVRFCKPTLKNWKFNVFFKCINIFFFKNDSTFSEESESDDFWIRCPKLNGINTWLFILAQPWWPSAETGTLKFLPEPRFCSLWRSWRDYFWPCRANLCSDSNQCIFAERWTLLPQTKCDAAGCLSVPCGGTGFNGVLLTQKLDTVVQISPVLKMSVSFYQHSFSYYSLPSPNYIKNC